ncbi:hypothetical protein CARUB_v10016514mg [Capsella rubella]|uniref:Retrotransposon Copia-like N-terminal domain-containing protein n=1 Tax=Capsella rubella TaxID=81985 RepID=R0ETG1_9BRAS|nr:hypothetical protein CARUB_v10016514mg [Capsella rubella]
MFNITKLNANNLITWRLQIRALLEAHELHCFISDDDKTPPATADSATAKDQPNPAFQTLYRTYGKPSRGHVKQVRQQLKQSTKGSKTINEYMPGIIDKSNQLALLGAPLDHENLLHFITESLGEDLGPIAVI